MAGAGSDPWRPAQGLPSTIPTSLLPGLCREEVARFSFLLGIPVVALAGLNAIGDAVQQSGTMGRLPLLAGAPLPPSVP